MRAAAYISPIRTYLYIKNLPRKTSKYLTLRITETIIELCGGVVQMAKMGRPKSDNAKTKIMCIRVEDARYQKICEYAAKHQMTVTDVVMQGLELLLSKSK